MKSFIVTLVILCVAITGGTIVYLNRQKAPLVAAPVAELLSRQTEQTQPEKSVAQKLEEPRIVSDKVSEPTPIPVTNSVSSDLKPNSVTTALSQAVDTLISAQTSLSDKETLWKKLTDAGELDQVIAELKQRAANNPNDPEIPAELGEAELYKAGAIFQNGGNVNEMGMLAIQADQSFDAALKLDPSNWEAQFFKVDAMSHLPAEFNKGQEVIQRLSSLINQQATMSPQPQFAQTYVLLGDQYQKMGKPDYAGATWQLGAGKFPNDPALQKKISGQ